MRPSASRVLWTLLPCALILAGPRGGGTPAWGDPPATAYVDFFEEASPPVKGPSSRAGLPGAPQVREARARLDLLQGLKPGQAIPVRFNAFPGRELRGWVGAPRPSFLGFVRWPVTLEEGSDPFASVVLVGSGGPDRASDPPAGALRSRRPLVPRITVWIRSPRFGLVEVESSERPGLVVLRATECAPRPRCGVRAPPRLRASAPGRGGRRAGCRCHDGGPAGGGDWDEQDIDTGIVPYPPPGNVTLATIRLFVMHVPWTVFDKSLVPIGTDYTQTQIDAYVAADATIRRTIASAVEDLNDVLVKSLVAAQIELVGPRLRDDQAISYFLTPRHQDCRVTHGQLRGGPAPGAENLWIEAAHGLRDLYAADLVCLVVDGAPAGDGALASFAGYADQYHAWLSPEEKRESAFSVVRVSAIGQRSLAHEIGHNLGACHAYGDEDCDGGWGARHPHRFYGPGGEPYMTLMGRAAPGDSTERVDVFSNPNRYVSGYGYLGDWDSAYNARIVGSAALEVAQYRP